MKNWNALTSVVEVRALVERSFEVPCVIFKHSTSCSISLLAKYRLEGDWDFEDTELEPYYLDLLQYREVSNFVAEHFEVHHESPQVLLIREGVCTYDSSHLDITVAELHECYNSPV
ncbi:MAG: bacillithiol system redox-active protein YtxJ [Bacteroidota bacterium]